MLDQSSGEEEPEEEEINAYTATQGTRSPHRILLEELPASDPEEVSEFYDHDGTDIELLKRCITLTNENNTLKLLVERLSAQVDSLKADLRTSAENEATLRKRAEGRDASAERKEELLKFEQAMQMIELEKQEMERERAALRLKEEELSGEQAVLRQQWQQF